MLTLLVSVLATAYFVVPELLSRFILRFFMIRKVITSPRGEEVVRAAAWALIPLTLAWITRNRFWLTMPTPVGSSLRSVFTILYTDKSFPERQSEFFQAFGVFIQANVCLLSRIYFIVILGCVCLGIATRKFGYLREKTKGHRFVSKCLHWAVIPRISEWHVALSPMLLYNPKQYSIEIDAMTKTGILYRGAVHEKSIAADGTLQTVILSSPERFNYEDYVRARTAYEQLPDKSIGKPLREDYWRKIPGEMFLIAGSDVTSVNVRHVAGTMSAVNPQEDSELIGLLKELNGHLKTYKNL
jgi:hypothetical protein